MVSTSGFKLISDDAVKTLCEELFPLATVITPNIPEAEILCGKKFLQKSRWKKPQNQLAKNSMSQFY